MRKQNSVNETCKEKSNTWIMATPSTVLLGKIVKKNFGRVMVHSAVKAQCQYHKIPAIKYSAWMYCQNK